MATLSSTSATGRRKSASARVYLRSGSGNLTVNKTPFEQYFKERTLRNYITQPLQETGTSESFDISIRVTGGGKMGQAGAIRHGIARVLLKEDTTTRSVLKASAMLSRDARVKERKKPGQPGARKRFQFSKR